MSLRIHSMIGVGVVAMSLVGCRPHQASEPAVMKAGGGIGSTPSIVTSPGFVDGKPAGYGLAWSDEFSGSTGSKPDPETWQFDTGGNGWGNKELETYVNDLAHCRIASDPDATDGKALEIDATKDAGGHYQSARVTSQDHLAFQNGYIEARLKLPAGRGLWPSFWMMGTDIAQHGWPTCGMINVISETGDQPAAANSAIYGADFGTDQIRARYNLPDGRSFADSYHRFGVKWDIDTVTFYVDGVPYATKSAADVPGHSWPFSKPFFLLLNVAVGGTSPGSPDANTKFPAKFMVDYVRVYKKGYEGPVAFNGPHDIPGTVQCEDYDDGGEGVAYFDKDGINSTGRYRPTEGPDIENADDPKTGYAIGWTNPGQWLKYTVVAGKSGSYQVGFRVAAGDQGGAFHVEDETGKNVTGRVDVAATGGWQNWTTINRPLRLTAGRHVLKLVEDTGGYNLDYITFS